MEISQPLAPQSAGMETVLVADDEGVVQTHLKMILEKAGYKVIVAGDGEEGVARFRENSAISLVLADVVLPGKNGLEMLNEIRKMKPGIKVLFISGYTAEFLRDNGTIDDAAQLITKPFRTGDLLQKVRDVLDKD